MFWKEKSLADLESAERERRALRRILEACAASGEPAPPTPFLMARLEARIAAEVSEAARTKGRAPAELALGAAARSLAPAFAILLTVLSAVTAYQQAAAVRAENEAIARILEPQNSSGDLLLAALFLGGDSGAGGLR
ncbi:MAG: hypothetical protein ABIQ65_16605 [Thermoanaerobaculia bacterium]